MSLKKANISIFKQSLVQIIALILLFFISTIFLTSYQKPPIEKPTYLNYQKAIPNDTITIRWNFKNANYTKILGSEKKFKAVDSIKVSTNTDTTIKIIAYNLYGDTVCWDYRIIIDNEIRRGDAFSQQYTLPTSYSENNYFVGIANFAQDNIPAKIKITKLIYPSEQENNCILEAIVLDKYGNFIKNIVPNNTIYCNIKQTCNFDTRFLTRYNFQEFTPYLHTNNLNISFIIDNSAPASYNSEIIEQISNSLDYLDNSDIINLGLFNQNYQEIFSQAPKNNALINLNNFDPPKPKGLSAIYKSLNFALSNYHNELHNNFTNLIILISQNLDNSSILFTVNDIIEKARNQKIPIYTIGIGSNHSSYILNLIADATGGKFYSFWKFESDSIQYVINEILLSQKYHYKTTIPIINFDNPCATQPLIFNLAFEELNIQLSDNYNIINGLHTPYSPYQSIALFDNYSIKLEEEYTENILNLALILKQFPDLQIELIGNSSKEGDDIFNDSIALERALSVKNKLLEFNIPESQIKVKSAASRKRLFFIETAPWQSLYNRRVDIRWLDPSLEPYEIIAETVFSETEALQKVENWEKKGFKSYYDRYYENERPTYKVKIWGFHTYDEARKTCEKLEKQYKKSFIVE